MQPEDHTGERDAPGAPRPRHVMYLEHKERRRVIVLATTRTIAAAAALLALFFALDFDWSPVAQALAVITVGLAFVGGVVLWELRSVARAEFPVVRAFEALAFSSVLLVLLFAGVYLSLSHDDPASFSEPLSHTGALYFTLTTLTTVGFGDIAARTDDARVAVMVQMVANFVVLGVLLKLILAIARKRIDDADDEVAR